MTNGLKILDFRDVYSEKDSLFENQDHLTRSAGETFTELLFSDLTKK